MPTPLKRDPEPWWQDSSKKLLRQTIQHLSGKPTPDRPGLLNAMLLNSDHAESDHVPYAMHLKREPRTFETVLRTIRHLNGN